MKYKANKNGVITAESDGQAEGDLPDVSVTDCYSGCADPAELT